MRCISVKDVNSKHQRTFYVTSTSMVVLAPVVMAAACYICFVSILRKSYLSKLIELQGRVVFHVVPKPARTLKLLWVSPRWLTPLFVGGDAGKCWHVHIMTEDDESFAVALVLQLIGVILVTTGDQAAVNAKTRADRGKRFAQSGIALQVLFFGLFSVIAVRFNFTSKRFASDFEQRIQPILTEGSEQKQETYVTISDCPRKVKRTWQSVLLVTNVSSICILVSLNPPLTFHDLALADFIFRFVRCTDSLSLPKEGQDIWQGMSGGNIYMPNWEYTTNGELVYTLSML